MYKRQVININITAVAAHAVLLGYLTDQTLLAFHLGTIDVYKRQVLNTADNSVPPDRAELHENSRTGPAVLLLDKLHIVVPERCV